MNEILSKEYARWLNGWQASPPPTEEQIRVAKCREGYHHMIQQEGDSVWYEWRCRYCGFPQKALMAHERKRVSYEY